MTTNGSDVGQSVLPMLSDGTSLSFSLSVETFHKVKVTIRVQPSPHNFVCFNKREKRHSPQ